MASSAVIKPEMLGGLPLVSVIGTPRTMGAHIGLRMQPRLQSLSQYFTEQVLAASGTPDAIRAELSNTARTIRSMEPSLWMEIEAMAQTSGMTEEDLLLVHGYDDLIGHYRLALPPTRSSFISLPGGLTADGHPRLVFAWHLDATLMPYVTVVRRIPAHGPASLTLTLAGLHPVAGLSEAGIAAAKNELIVTDGRPGHLTAHLIASALTSPAMEEAEARIAKGPRFGGGALHLLASTGSRRSCELSGTGTLKLDDPMPAAPRVHTSHAVHPEVMQWNAAAADPDAKDRLAYLASHAVEAADIDDEGIAAWFGLGKGAPKETAEDFDGGFRPEHTVLLIADPVAKSIAVRRGGTPAPMSRAKL